MLPEKHLGFLVNFLFFFFTELQIHLKFEKQQPAGAFHSTAGHEAAVWCAAQGAAGECVLQCEALDGELPTTVEHRAHQG